MYVTIKKQGSNYTIYHRERAKRVYVMTDNLDDTKMRNDGYYQYKVKGIQPTQHADMYRLTEPQYVRDVHYVTIKFNVNVSSRTGRKYTRTVDGFLNIYRHDRQNNKYLKYNCDELDVGAYEISIDIANLKQENRGEDVITTIFIGDNMPIIKNERN